MWNEKETNKARALFEKFGKRPGTMMKIARILKRTNQSVTGHLHRHGITIRQQHEWTQREIKILRKYYGKETVGQIGERIGRTAASVMGQAHVLGLKRRMPPRAWTPREDQRLRTLHAQGYDMRHIADTLKRTKVDVKAHARALGILRPQKAWNAKDERLLRKLQPLLPYPEIARRMDRPVGAVRARIHTLGLGRENTSRPWTPQEDERLRKLFGTMESAALGELFDRTTSAVRLRAAKLGVAREAARHWAAEDVEKLIQLHRAGVAYEEIARILDRTVVSVQVRANKLRLNARPRRGKKKGEK